MHVCVSLIAAYSAHPYTLTRAPRDALPHARNNFRAHTHTHKQNKTAHTHGTSPRTTNEPYIHTPYSTQSSLWGPTCDGLDCLTKEAQLPQLSIGDWLVYDCMGAYTVAAGSCFNGFPRPRRLYINTEFESTPRVMGANCNFTLDPVEISVY